MPAVPDSAEQAACPPSYRAINPPTLFPMLPGAAPATRRLRWVADLN